MKLLITIISMTLIMTSCQTGSYKHKNTRHLASYSSLPKFLRAISSGSADDVQKLEKSIISYIQKHEENMTHGNHVVVGISKEEAQQIKSLSDDLPFMGKVHAWAMENITLVDTSISTSVARKAFSEISTNSNPYPALTTSAQGVRRAQRHSQSPYKSIANGNERVLASIEEISDAGIKKVLRKNYAELAKRGKSDPQIMANAQEIMKSAVNITKKSGRNSIGEGCAKFNQTASSEVLSMKAAIDLDTANKIQNLDFTGRSSSEVSEMIETTRVSSFQDILGYTDDEARAALRRLKAKPCRVY